MPGHLMRRRLVDELAKCLGSRFAVFGRGWGGFPVAKGPLPFAEQEKVLRESWLSIGLDSFPNIPMFFSNRLPIALSSGVAYLSSRQPGLDQLFEDGTHLVFYDSVNDAIRKVRGLLNGPKERLIDLGMNGRNEVLTKHTTDIRMKFILKEMAALHEAKGSG